MSKKENKNKEVIFILQSKGGVGKSMLAYLLANKHLDKYAYVDLDNTTRTSKKQLSFATDLFEIDVQNIDKQIDREKIINLFEFITNLEKSTIVDFGASESEQFLHLLEEFGGKELLKSLEETYNIKVKLFVVIAGGNSLFQSLSYYAKFETYKLDCITVYINEHTFSDENSIIELEKKLDTSVEYIRFGNLSKSSNSTQEILNNAKNGNIITDSISFATKLKVKSLLEKI